MQYINKALQSMSLVNLVKNLLLYINPNMIDPLYKRICFNTKNNPDKYFIKG